MTTATNNSFAGTVLNHIKDKVTHPTKHFNAMRNAGAFENARNDVDVLTIADRYLIELQTLLDKGGDYSESIRAAASVVATPAGDDLMSIGNDDDPPQNTPEPTEKPSQTPTQAGGEKTAETGAKEADRPAEEPEAVGILAGLDITLVFQCRNAHGRDYTMQIAGFKDVDHIKRVSEYVSLHIPVAGWVEQVNNRDNHNEPESPRNEKPESSDNPDERYRDIVALKREIATSKDSKEYEFWVPFYEKEDGIQKIGRIMTWGDVADQLREIVDEDNRRYYDLHMLPENMRFRAYYILKDIGGGKKVSEFTRIERL